MLWTAGDTVVLCWQYSISLHGLKNTFFLNSFFSPRISGKQHCGFGKSGFFLLFKYFEVWPVVDYFFLLLSKMLPFKFWFHFYFFIKCQVLGNCVPCKTHSTVTLQKRKRNFCNWEGKMWPNYFSAFDFNEMHLGTKISQVLHFQFSSEGLVNFPSFLFSLKVPLATYTHLFLG